MTTRKKQRTVVARQLRRAGLDWAAAHRASQEIVRDGGLFSWYTGPGTLAPVGLWDAQDPCEGPAHYTLNGARVTLP